MVLILILAGGIGAAFCFVLALLFDLGLLAAVIVALIAGTVGIVAAAAWLAIAHKRRKAGPAKRDRSMSQPPQQPHSSESHPQERRSDLAASP